MERKRNTVKLKGWELRSHKKTRSRRSMEGPKELHGALKCKLDGF